MRKTANPREIDRRTHLVAPRHPHRITVCAAPTSTGNNTQHASTSSSVTRFARSPGHKHIGRTRVPVVHFQKNERAHADARSHTPRVAPGRRPRLSSSLFTRRTLKRLPCKRRAMSRRSASSDSESDSNSSRSGDARPKAKPFELLVFSECTFDGSGPVVYYGTDEKLERLLCEIGLFMYG